MIHPGTTLEKHEYDTVVFVGKLDDDGESWGCWTLGAEIQPWKSSP
jgi:hypothetical protein